MERDELKRDGMEEEEMETEEMEVDDKSRRPQIQRQNRENVFSQTFLDA